MKLIVQSPLSRQEVLQQLELRSGLEQVSKPRFEHPSARRLDPLAALTVTTSMASLPSSLIGYSVFFARVAVRSKEDTEVRRLWKKFQQVLSLPEKDHRAVIRLVNSLVGARAR